MLYTATIPKISRKRENPWTPDPYDARMSKRQFEGRIKAWRTSVKILMEDRLPHGEELCNSSHMVGDFCLFLRECEVERFEDKPVEIFVQPHRISQRKIDLGI